MFDVRCKHGFSFNSRLTLNVSEKSRSDWWIEQASVAAPRCAGKPPGGLHSPMGIRVSVSEERESIYDLNMPQFVRPGPALFSFSVWQKTCWPNLGRFRRERIAPLIGGGEIFPGTVEP